jgi:hypothetical protein
MSLWRPCKLGYVHYLVQVKDSDDADGGGDDAEVGSPLLEPFA